MALGGGLARSSNPGCLPAADLPAVDEGLMRAAAESVRLPERPLSAAAPQTLSSSTFLQVFFFLEDTRRVVPSLLKFELISFGAVRQQIRAFFFSLRL